MGRASTLTKEDIRLIRAAAAERDRLREEAMKLSNYALAEKFGVSITAISCVINNYYTYRLSKEK